MKVLHVSGARSWGGNEQQLLYLMDELEKKKIEQVLFCYKDTPLFFKAQVAGVIIQAIKFVKPFKSEYRKHLSLIVKNHHIDLIHLHTSDSVTGFVITNMLLDLKTPTVFSKKGIGSKISVLSKFKYNYSKINRILCVSKYVEKHFKNLLYKKNQQKLVTIYDGVKVEKNYQPADFDLKIKLNLSLETFIIGNIANHTSAKDLPTLILMLDYLVNVLLYKDVHLVQIGQFSRLTTELKQMVENHNLEGYISFMDFLENASAYFPQFNVFVISSEREGGPSSILEAFSRKIPVISTRVGIVDEVIKDGYNGFAVQPKSPKELAEKITAFRVDPKLSNLFVERSYDLFLEKFTSNSLGKNTLQAYKDVLNENDRNF